MNNAYNWQKFIIKLFLGKMMFAYKNRPLFKLGVSFLALSFSPVYINITAKLLKAHCLHLTKGNISFDVRETC